jgi:cytochrome c oxidase assembly protein Cox11
MLPTKGTQQDRRTSTDEIRIYQTEGHTLVWKVKDDAKALVDLSGKTLVMIIEGENRNDKAVIQDADISVSGTGNATYTIDIPTTVSARSGKTYNF